MTAIDIMKSELIGWLSIQSDPELIKKFNQLKEQEEGDWWDELDDSQKAAVEEGLEGKSHTFEGVRQYIKEQHGI